MLLESHVLWESVVTSVIGESFFMGVTCVTGELRVARELRVLWESQGCHESHVLWESQITSVIGESRVFWESDESHVYEVISV